MKWCSVPGCNLLSLIPVLFNTKHFLLLLFHIKSSNLAKHGATFVVKQPQEPV